MSELIMDLTNNSLGNAFRSYCPNGMENVYVACMKNDQRLLYFNHGKWYLNIKFTQIRVYVDMFVKTWPEIIKLIRKSVPNQTKLQNLNNYLSFHYMYSCAYGILNSA